MKFNLKKYGPRLFPSDARSESKNVIEIEGVGKFYLRDVGNTSYTTATEVYLHRTGRKNTNGFLRYHPHITDEGKVVWRSGTLNWAIRYGNIGDRPEDETIFPASTLPIVYRLLDETATRDPNSFLFFMISICESEMRRHQFNVDELRASIEYMNELLNPKNHTPAEWRAITADKLEWWLKNLNNSTLKLTRYFNEYGERWLMLERIYRAMRRWASRCKPETETPMLDLIAQAVGEVRPRERPPMSKMWD